MQFNILVGRILNEQQEVLPLLDGKREMYVLEIGYCETITCWAFRYENSTEEDVVQGFFENSGTLFYTGVDYKHALQAFKKALFSVHMRSHEVDEVFTDIVPFEHIEGYDISFGKLKTVVGTWKVCSWNRLVRLQIDVDINAYSSASQSQQELLGF
jgi:hypothetical protein